MRMVEKVEHWRQGDVVGRALVFRIEVDATGIDYGVQNSSTMSVNSPLVMISISKIA